VQGSKVTCLRLSTWIIGLLAALGLTPLDTRGSSANRGTEGPIEVPRCSSVCMEQLARFAPVEQAAAVLQQYASTDEVETFRNNLEQAFWSTQAKFDGKAAIANAVAETAADPLDSLQDASLSPAVTVVAAQINLLAEEQIAKVQGALLSRQVEIDTQLLVNVLASIRLHNPKSFATLAELPTDERLSKIMKEEVTSVSDETWRSLAASRRAAVLDNALERTFNDAYQQAQVAIPSVDQIREAAQFVASIQTVVNARRDEIDRDFKRLGDDARNIEANVTLLKSLVRNGLDNFDYQFLKQMLTGTANSEAVSSALTEQFIRRISNADQGTAKAAIEILSVRLTLDKTPTDSFAMASSLVDIAEAVNLPIDIRSCRNGLQTAQQLYTLAKSWGNPLAMADAISGFGGFSDPGAALNAEILRELGLIREEILALRREVQILRQEMHAQFDHLNAKIDGYHQEQITKLDGLFNQQVEAHALLQEINSKDLRRCHDLSMVEERRLQARSHDAFREEFDSTLAGIYADCARGFRSDARIVESELGRTLSNFRLIETGSDAKEFTKYKARIFNPALEWHRYHAPGRTSKGLIDDVTIALWGSQMTLESERADVAGVEWGNIAGKETARLKIKNGYKLLEAPLGLVRLIEYAPSMRSVTAMFDQVEPWDGVKPRLLRIDELSRRTEVPEVPSRIAIQIAQSYALMLDAAIAQNNMVSGVLMVPWLAEKVDSAIEAAEAELPEIVVPNESISCPVTDTYAAALCLLNASPVLRYNFSIYWVAHRLKRKGHDLFQYRLAHKSSSGAPTDPMWALGEATWPAQTFQKRAPNKESKIESWQLRLPVKGKELFVALPAPGDVKAQEYAHGSEYFELIRQRQLTREHVGRMLFANELDEADRSRLFATQVYARRFGAEPRTRGEARFKAKAAGQQAKMQ
jgi:hypothetical protein